MTTTTFGRDVPRAILCCCGWGGRFPSLPATNAALDRHLDEATEGCDHVWTIWDAAALL